MASSSSSDNPTTRTSMTPSFIQDTFEPLTYERHWRYGLMNSGADFAFCKNMTSCRLRTPEFESIAKSFPIVFFEQDSYLPHAILGLMQTINLALNHRFEWRKNLTCPLELKAYPFGLIQVVKDGTEAFSDSLPISDTAYPHEKSLLAISKTTPTLVPIQSHPMATQLFQIDGSVTPFVSQQIATQTSMKAEQLETASFVSAMRANKLLTPKSIKLHFKDATTLIVDGFCTISKTEVSKASETTINRWQEQGYMDLITQHWQSQKMWARLISLHERRMRRDLRALRLKERV